MPRALNKGFLVPLFLAAVVVVSAAVVVYFQSEPKRGEQPASMEIVPFVQEGMLRVATTTADAPSPVSTEVKLEKAVPAAFKLESAAASKVESVSLQSFATNTYVNTEFGFSVKYPASLVVEEGTIAPNTRFVVFKDPAFADAVVSEIYISESAKVDISETVQGQLVKVGSKDARKFTDSTSSFYWVEAGKYSLAVSLIAPKDAPKDYATFIDLESFTF